MKRSLDLQAVLLYSWMRLALIVVSPFGRKIAPCVMEMGGDTKWGCAVHFILYAPDMVALKRVVVIVTLVGVCACVCSA